MSCSIGPLTIDFRQLRFLPAYEGQNSTALEEQSGPDIVRNYLLDATLTTPTGLLGLMPNPVALTREVLRAIRQIALKEPAYVYLVEDCEYSISVSPIRSGGDLVEVTLCGPGTDLSTWNESEDRLIVELTSLIHEARALLSEQVQISLEDMLAKSLGEVSWYSSTDT